MGISNFEQVCHAALALPPQERQQLIARLTEADEPQRKTKPPLKPAWRVPETDFSKEMDWLADTKNRVEYGGQWVALKGEEVLAHGFVAREVFAAGRATGVERPFFARVEPPPEPNTTFFAGWL
jgi:hypothetical protein